MTLKICVATGGRADYGLLKKLMLLLKKDNYFKLQTIITGSHLYKKFGHTLNEVKNDRFRINEKIYLNIKSDGPVDISKSLGIGIKEFAGALNRLKPDILLVLGDRYEIFALTVSAHLLSIPIAHLHGGETTEGAIDEAFRHSITKMSDFHFVANKIYKKRVIQLGENPKNIFLVGGLGVDQIEIRNLYSQKQIEKKLKIKLYKKNLLITYHPETIKKDNEVTSINPLLKSLKRLNNTQLIFTIPNFDTFNHIIFSQIKKFVKANKNAHLYSSLGHRMYLSCLRFVDGVIGNSSSGLFEVPYFKKATINIGDRQRGRIKIKSVINTTMNSKNITRSINYLYKSELKKNLKNILSPYGKGGAGKKIINILKKIKIKNIKRKKFFDINFNF